MSHITRQSFLDSHLPVLPSLRDFQPDPSSGRSTNEQKQELFCRSALFLDPQNLDFDWLPVEPVVGQPTIEAALLALSLLLNDYTPPSKILEWLHAVASSPIVQTTKVEADKLQPNNWSWSRLFLRTYLSKKYGAVFPSDASDLNSILAMRRSDGLFLDGKVFDYYCGWDMQFWPHFYSMLVPEDAEYWSEAAKTFLPRYAALFDVDSGKNFAFGRSQHYGLAAASPFVACWFNPAYSGPSYYNLVAKNIAYHRGVRLPRTDWYASNYSWLICGKTFLARFLPSNSGFWSQPLGSWHQSAKLDKFSLTPKSVSPSQFVVDGQLVEVDKRYLTCQRI